MQRLDLASHAQRALRGASLRKKKKEEEEKEEEEEEEAAAAASPAPANSALRATFDKYDVDRDGMLNQ
eukprot:SAG31_NODE_12104_length_968_cov_1.020713_1_plen_67_part_10